MKRKMMYLISSFVWFSFLSSQCEMDKSYTIDLINKSGHKIGYYFALGGQYGTFYPDSLPITNNYIVYDMNKEIASGAHSGLSWDRVFSQLPKDTMSIFIFHTDTLNKYTWEEVRDRYMILSRYDLSLQDIVNLNHTIPYPPTEAMKEMKMYLPYGQ